MTPSGLDAFFAQAWDEHADHRGACARRIAYLDLLAQHCRALRDAAAQRALAAAGNNLAAGLEEKPDRDAAGTAGMVAAAQAGVECWRRAGTWLEHERAEYRLARSLLAAGQAADAAMAALQGLPA
jgi:hypothetical protein